MFGKNTGLRVSTFLLNAFWRALYALNLCLWLLLALQSCLALLFCIDFKVRLPQKCVDIIKQEVSRAGLDIDLENIRVDIRGNLSADSIKARFNGTPKNFFTAEKVFVSFWLPKLLHGEVGLRSLRIVDAKLGSTYAGVDGAEVVSSLFVELHSYGDWFNVNALSMRVGKLYLNLSGYVNSDFSVDALFNEAFKREAPKETKSNEPLNAALIAKKWDMVLEAYPQIKSHIDKFSDPMLDVSFTLLGDGEDSIVITFLSSRTSMPINGESASIENINLRLFHRNCGGVTRAETILSADNFSLKGYPSFENVSVHSDIAIEKDYIALENFDATIRNLVCDGTRVGNIRVGKDILNEKNWHGNWTFFVRRDTYRVGGFAEVTENLDVKFECLGRIDVRPILARKELSDIPELKQLDFPGGIELSVEGEYFAKDKRILLDSSIETENCLIMNIPVKSVSGDVFYSSDNSILEAKNLNVKTSEGWNVEGEFIQNFDTNGYVVRVLGDLRPMAIAHFMEPWWTRIMKDFIFKGESNFPKADVYVEGVWGKPENIWCYAFASGENAEYHGATFSNFALNVLVNPQRISLYDVAIKSSSGSANASLDWLYGEEGITTFKEQKIFMDSTLSPDEIIALGGDDAREVLDVVRFESSPHLIFNASMRNPTNNPENLDDIFNATVNSKGIVRIETAVLKNFSFVARSNKVNTDIENIKSDFCKGNVDGRVYLKKVESGMSFDAQLNGENINQLEFTEFLMSLGGSSGENNKDSKKVNNEETKKSLVDGGENGSLLMSINLTGNTDDFEKCSGNGYAALENKDLVKLNLLGMLSRALAALRLPLGAFDVTYARGPFEISNGNVKFTTLELGGPVMQIKGAANYDFINDNLDASLNVDPFGGITTPIVSNVVSIITPLTNTIQVNIKGELADPKIGVSVKPTNIIRSEEKIIEKIRNEL